MHVLLQLHVIIVPVIPIIHVYIYEILVNVQSSYPKFMHLINTFILL